MKLFVIETKELVDSELGWKRIAITSILSENIHQALIDVDAQHKANQYIHNVVSMMEKKDESVVWEYFK